MQQGSTRIRSLHAQHAAESCVCLLALALAVACASARAAIFQKLCNMAAAATVAQTNSEVAPPIEVATSPETEPRRDHDLQSIGHYHVLSGKHATGGFGSVYPCQYINSKGVRVNVAVKLSTQPVGDYDDDTVLFWNS